MQARQTTDERIYYHRSFAKMCSSCPSETLTDGAGSMQHCAECCGTPAAERCAAPHCDNPLQQHAGHSRQLYQTFVNVLMEMKFRCSNAWLQSGITGVSRHLGIALLMISLTPPCWVRLTELEMAMRSRNQGCRADSEQTCSVWVTGEGCR